MKVINGNNIDLLKQYPDNYFDAIVTDPPYGLGKEPNAEALMKDWIEKGYHEIQGSGFMGKEWDAFVPQPIFWKEVFRVLKHGGHVLSFFGTRTYDWGVMAMRFAGFEVRDCIQWLYGCLSDDTEILTKDGYIQYHKFIKLPNFEQKEILIYDAENDIYKWEKPERWNEYNINKDKCYRIKSNSTDQIVSRNHRCLVEREGKLVFVQAEQLSEMEYMPTLSNDFHLLQKPEILQSSMQRIFSGTRMEETRKQGEEFLVGGNQREISFIYDRRKEPILERGSNLSQKERLLFGSQTEICEMSEGVSTNGKERRVCNGISFNNGETIRETFIDNGMCTSYRPQSNEQRHNEFDVICNEQRPQKIRMGRSYSTTLATITPFEYTGVIFCPTTSTGCFVARRNGKAFITGNSGFPKSHNISKAIDKMYGAEREVIGKGKSGDPKTHTNMNMAYKEGSKSIMGGEYDITSASTDQAKQWDGWGSALKPANEPIVLARKPLEKGLSIAENVLKWGVGAINIDGCRVGFTDNVNMDAKQTTNNLSKVKFFDDDRNDLDKPIETYKIGGRFPANLILTHHPECECVGTKKVGKGERKQHEDGEISNANEGWHNNNKSMFTHKDSSVIANYGEETIEDWNCHPDCPIKILDEQSGESKSQRSERGNIIDNNVFGKYNPQENTTRGHNDKGGASRFFYVAKASKSERNKGLDGFDEKPLAFSNQAKAELKRGNDNFDGGDAKGHGNSIRHLKNFHPTVKPIKLMQYLVRLITPPNGIVLDPFCGSGTTGVACKLEAVDFVGMEQDPEYTKIAQARIDNYVDEKAKATDENTSGKLIQQKLF